MSTFTITWVNNVVNGKSIKVLLAGDNRSEVTQWAWIPADKNPQKGNTVTCDDAKIKFGPVETEYVDANGQVVALKGPRQQVSFFGKPVLADGEVTPTEWVDTRNGITANPEQSDDKPPF